MIKNMPMDIDIKITPSLEEDILVLSMLYLFSLMIVHGFTKPEIVWGYITIKIH